MWTEDDRKFVRQLRVATTENKIYEVVSNYYGNVKVKQSMAFHNAIISLFSKPTNDEEVLEALKVIYPKYAIVYPNLNSS